MRRAIRILCALCALCLPIAGCSTANHSSAVSLRINEVQTSGADADWIEVLNTGTDAVNLDGCFLSDDPETPGKWMFPAITLEAGDYLVVYADKSATADRRLSLPFALSSSGETVVLSDPNGTPLSTVVVPAASPGLSYGCDTNGEYVWYASPTPGTSNENGMLLGKEMIHPENGLRINEYMSRNRSVLYDRDGDYPDWVELHNFSDEIIDLSGYCLTDSKDTVTKWRFPAGTTISAGGYLVVFCSEKIGSPEELHASFKLGDGDSFLGLYTAAGGFCSGITYHATEQDTSVGYSDSGEYVTYRYPTPGYANTME